jgi:hypothetical protein
MKQKIILCLAFLSILFLTQCQEKKLITKVSEKH